MRYSRLLLLLLGGSQEGDLARLEICALSSVDLHVFQPKMKK
jgi:hypothetical protein